jgi:hypothetical protein
MGDTLAGRDVGEDASEKHAGEMQPRCAGHLRVGWRVEVGGQRVLRKTDAITVIDGLIRQDFCGLIRQQRTVADGEKRRRYGGEQRPARDRPPL